MKTSLFIPRSLKILLAVALSFSTAALAEVRLANVFSDHMVLQRDMPLPVWGTATPGKEVVVTFAGQSKRALTDSDGRWMVTLNPISASAAPCELTVLSEKTKSESQKLSDVLVGDVWFCAGPGGEFNRPTERMFKIGAAETAKASHPQVRVLRPIVDAALLPVEDIDQASRWVAVTPQTVGALPNTWYIGRELYAVADVPIGIIQVHTSLERVGAWQVWKQEPQNAVQSRIVAAVVARIPQEIAANERWLMEMNDWKPGLPQERLIPTYLSAPDEAPAPLHVNYRSAYNSSVVPFVGMAVRGVIFLNEFGKFSVAKTDLVSLVNGWREVWGRPQMPFLFIGQIQRQPVSPQVEEALATVSTVPMVKLIGRQDTTENLWREVAASAKDIPVGPVEHSWSVRKWAAQTPVQMPKKSIPLEAACVFADNMVLQSGMPVPVWGWAEPGTEISVAFSGQNVKGMTNARGEWRVMLTPLTTNRTPAEMIVTGHLGNQMDTLRFGNALVGEVWGNAGQSNAGRVMADPDEKPKADWPEIRFFRVTEAGDGFPSRRAHGRWLVVTPQTVVNMPGQGYFFARQIHEQLKTPVGILNSSVVGSSIFSWTTEAALSSSPKLKPLLDDFLKCRDARLARVPELKEMVRHWVDESRRNGAVARPMAYYPVKDMIMDGVADTRGGVLYNAMISPIIGTAVRGYLWNQGEADTGAGIRSETYAELMQTMVADWRKSWGYQFPFYFVQMPARITPGLTQMWEKQTAAMKTIPNSGMIVSNDISDGDVHPADKKNVGERLARLALARTYGVKSVLDSSPFMKSVTRQGSGVVVTFAPVGDGLKTRDGKAPDSWELAGVDGKFVAAKGVIEGDRVRVEAPGINHPVSVRLGWSEVSNCNLINSAGLPAMPFSGKID